MTMADAGSNTRGGETMGYYERKAAEAFFGLAMATVVVALIAVGPWMLGNAIAGSGLAWTFEVLYIIGAVWLVAWAVRRQRRIDAAKAQHRAAMARTGQAWFDPDAGHFRHGTCSIRHRSFGAAQRCNSQI